MHTEQKIQRGVRLNVKLMPGLDPRRSEEILSETPGIQLVTQTFPEEKDLELSALYVLEVNPSDVESALKQLRQNPHVEYVEETASRKLIW